MWDIDYQGNNYNKKAILYYMVTCFVIIASCIISYHFFSKESFPVVHSSITVNKLIGK
jgi:hypothetical protein